MYPIAFKAFTGEKDGVSTMTTNIKKPVLLFIIARAWKQPRCPISRRMDKKAVLHIHYGILAIKKNSFESVLMRWMKLEPIIHSEVSQKETNTVY